MTASTSRKRFRCLRFRGADILHGDFLRQMSIPFVPKKIYLCEQYYQTSPPKEASDGLNGPNISLS
jgi:hypothetical protein